ncbi:F-box ubiquitin ligase [Scheffersomyces xylosifermentans]|uniref:F-box ubiquitin ligase n=1 Tax=Scheffersomyces xylosifermentans TaxID=1304137 RepID=UPI00315D42B7
MTLTMMERSGTDELGNTVVDFGGKYSTDTIKEDAKVNINDLPTEMIIHIFANLDPVYLNTVRTVCKRWNFVINDRQTWINSFNLKFNTPKVFPSLTNSANWMSEYFTRLQVMKNWKRSTALHYTYQVINNEYRLNDTVLTNFASNNGQGKILVFSKYPGNIALGNLTNGKNQSFIPGGNSSFYENLAHSLNWNYLLLGKANGDITLKNLITSTSSGSNRLSYTKFVDSEDAEDKSPVMAVELNSFGMDKYKTKIDAISGSFSGKLKLWNLNGQMLKMIKFPGEIILGIKSNFRKWIIVSTDSNVYIVDLTTQEVAAKIELGFTVANTEDPSAHSYYDSYSKVKNSLDVDFGDSNIIVCYQSIIKVFNFKDLNNIRTRELRLKDDVVVEKCKLQTMSNSRVLGTRNPQVIGGDGLLFANSLSDDTVIVWNVRDDEHTSTIVPHCKISLTFKDIKYTTTSSLFSPILDRNLPYITTIALNSSVIAIGGYNGVSNVYDVFTGKFVKEIYVKFPRKFTHMYQELIPVTEIRLNDDQQETNGLIICGDTVQYFQFGESKTSSVTNSDAAKRQKGGFGNYGKSKTKKKIKDGMEDYTSQKFLERQRQEQEQQLLDKYNGRDFDDDDEELSLALALSQSVNTSTLKLRLALELSKHLHESDAQAAAIDEEEDEVMRKVMELSLRDL